MNRDIQLLKSIRNGSPTIFLDLATMSEMCADQQRLLEIKTPRYLKGKPNQEAQIEP